MFKELKVIKLIVFVGLLITILLKMDFNEHVVNDLYTDKLSYFPDETVNIYSSSNSFFSLTRNISIINLAKKEVSSINIELSNQKSHSNPLIEGLGYKNFIEYKIAKNTKSGIYLVENRFPVIIKSKKQAEITIVYPYANNILYQSYNDKNVFSLKVKHASLNRSAPIDNYTKGLSPFFNYLDNTYQVSYISDLDLEDINNYKNSKILVMYGKLTSWTPEMKSSFKTYLTKGGNILLMSTNTLNNVCWYNKSENNIILYNDSSSAIKSWVNYDGNSLEKSIGVTYNNGGYSKNSTYQVADKDHPILAGLNTDIIETKATLYSSPPVKWHDGLPRIDLDSMNFYKGEIIAYGRASYKENQRGIKGIFVLQPDSNSGIIVSLGTEDWCLTKNYQENESIQLITKNAINFLLE